MLTTARHKHKACASACPCGQLVQKIVLCLRYGHAVKISASAKGLRIYPAPVTRSVAPHIGLEAATGRKCALRYSVKGRAGPICGARTGFAMPKKITTPWPPQ